MTPCLRPENPTSFGRRSLVAWVALAGFACESSEVAAPPTGPRFGRPIDVIPPDLQLTVRVAAKRLRESLGGAMVERIRTDSQLGAPLADPLIGWALERADTAWASLRLGLVPEQTDNVLVLSGSFAKLAPDRSHWLTPVDLGGGWQRWDRSEAVTRAEPARVYAFGGDVLVFVSEAEIDAVERRLERGVEVESVEPPELGLVSLAASMSALAHALRDKAPRAAELLEKGSVLTGHADFVHTRGATVDLDFGFKAAEQAERSARAAELLLLALRDSPGPVGRVAAAARVEAVGKSVALRLRLEPELLAALLASSTSASAAPESPDATSPGATSPDATSPGATSPGATSPDAGGESP